MFKPLDTLRHALGPAKPVVLVVDDDPGMRGFLRHVLNDAGYDAETAIDVYQAMDRLNGPSVAAVILDMLFINSGGRSGLDLLQFIRGSTRLMNLPVIILTGFSLNKQVVAQVKAHHAELWYKPVDPVDFVHRLHQLVQREMVGV